MVLALSIIVCLTSLVSVELCIASCSFRASKLRGPSNCTGSDCLADISRLHEFLHRNLLTYFLSSRGFLGNCGIGNSSRSVATEVALVLPVTNESGLRGDGGG